jgi:dTDP-4-dehydrorhamnose reductase
MNIGLTLTITISPTTGREKMDNSLVILGAKGMLGSDLATECRNHGLNPLLLDLPEFDITNYSRLPEVLKGAKVLVNCAAYTNVEKAETRPKLAHEINAQAVGHLASFAKDTGTWLLHISTDFVFDGKNDSPYTETDIPNPINTYGKSKLAGEKLLIESNCSHCIMRIEWTYGTHGNNFISKLLSRTGRNSKLRVVDDQIGSPTATTEVAKAICNLLKKKPQGLFHFASDGWVSRFEMAKFVFEKLNMPVTLTSCRTSDYKTLAARPLNSRFNCSKIKAVLNEPIEPWQKPLERFLRQL